MTEPDTTAGAPAGALDVLALDPPPYRVVDAHDWGWHTGGGHDEHGAPTYHRDWQGGAGDRPEPLTLAALADAAGPLRPVIHMPTPDGARLLRALVNAERRALLSVLVALRRVAYERTMARPAAQFGTYGHPLLGGRGGSHEAAALIDAVGWVATTRTGSSRIDGTVAEAVELIVGRWVGDRGGYVEVAANMSHLLGQAADLAEGREGPATIADQWLCRPGAAPPSVLRWGLTLSEHHPYAG